MSTDKGNLLNYLPPQQRQRVLLLIQRLQQQTQAKNKYQSLYTQARNEISQLQLKCNQLKDQNAYLKQQMHNSFSMISQVRANFKANKEKLSARKDQHWQDEDEEDEEQNKQNTSNLHAHPPKPNMKSSIEKYRPQVTSADKHSSILNISSNFLNQTSLQSASKGRQVEELRREVRALQMEKHKEEEKAKQLTQKHKLVDQIKSRYKTQMGSSRGKEDSSEKIEIDINQAFGEEEERETRNKSSAKKVNKPLEAIQKVDKKQQQPANKIQKVIPKHQSTSLSQTKQSSKQQSHPPDDYCDVLDLINDYNL